MGRTTALTIIGVCLVMLCVPCVSRAEDPQPPVYEMSNEPPPPAADETPAEPSPAPAVASPAEPSPKKPRTFALGVGLLAEHALIAAVVRLRYDHIAADVSYGINPVVVSYSLPDSDKGGFDAGMSWVHVDGSLVLFFNDDQKTFQNGLRFGSSYDRIVGFGAMVGWVGELGFERFALGFGAGLKFVPRYEERVREHFDIDEDAEFALPLWIGLYSGVSLRWYLF